MKPHVICHMMGSVDGRIKPDIWKVPGTNGLFEETAAKIPTDA